MLMVASAAAVVPAEQLSHEMADSGEHVDAGPPPVRSAAHSEAEQHERDHSESGAEGKARRQPRPTQPYQ
jgi:hypothetical protein